MGNREFCIQVERLRRVCVASADMDDDGPPDGGWSDADADADDDGSQDGDAGAGQSAKQPRPDASGRMDAVATQWTLASKRLPVKRPGLRSVCWHAGQAEGSVP